jgi:hypothetical protein
VAVDWHVGNGRGGSGGGGGVIEGGDRRGTDLVRTQALLYRLVLVLDAACA